ncbi:hypothetical protein ACFSCX_06475 [Bacillus salitolerans]|uniref:DUF5983 domain-containing protein n=1 Tax=Bacillus salitolerans TaxID=1437434 RepID=A0ABW4LND4_9BACI
MNIVKMLQLSTFHIKESTSIWLEEHQRYSLPLIVYSKAEYGWFIPIIKGWKDDVLHIPDDLVTIIEFAEGEGIEWVMLDRDCDLVSHLPIYQW